MTDKVIENIHAIKEYVDSISTQCTGAYNVWKADVIYESEDLGIKSFNDVEVLYQYSGDPKIIINAFDPPYYSAFDPMYQTFKCNGNNLVITGFCKNGNKYKVTIK